MLHVCGLDLTPAVSRLARAEATAITARAGRVAPAVTLLARFDLERIL
jgi:hypothetical protein